MVYWSVRPLRWHLFRLTLLGLVPLAVFAALAIGNAAQAHRAELVRSTLDLSRAVASAVQAELDGTLLTLASLARSPDLQAGDIATFYQRAQRLMELQSEWTAMTLSDVGGRVLFRTSLPLGTQIEAPVELGSLSAAIRTARPTVGSAMRGPRGAVTVAVRQPVFRDGQPAYVLTAVLRPDRLVGILQRQRVPDDWVIAILDADLRIFARSKAQEQFVLREASAQLRSLARPGRTEGSGMTRSQEGQRVLTGFSRTPEFGWVVAVGAPTTALAGFASPMVGLYLVGTVGSLLICAVLAARAARRISRDIRLAAGTAARLGKGKPIAQRSSRIAEIERLDRALHSAGHRLQEAQASQATALQQAQEAGRAKDEFLAILGHELRNPLAPMVSAMYLLDARSDATTARERGILRRQMDHMRRLVDDLMDVARVTRGKVDIHVAPVELVGELTAVLDDVRQAAPSAQRIEFRPGAAQAWVRGDAQRLAQVFTNLLSNAVRHGAGLPITVTLDVTGQTVRVRVQDQGEGMTGETLDHVFEPFYQAPQHPDRPRGGLGLGLAIVHSLVLAHDGTVSAASAGPGLGSRFDVVLPLMPQPPANPAADAA